MIVWSGRGILIVLVFLVSGLVFTPFFPKEDWGYVFAFSSFVTAAFSWFLGILWNNVEARIMIDEKTGQKIILKRNHSLFFIKMQYWGVIFSIIGIIILFNMLIMVGVIALIVTLLAVFFIYKNARIMNPQFIQSEMNNAKTIKKQTPISAPVNPDIEKEAEAERLKRKQEKEDPSRFMPH